MAASFTIVQSDDLATVQNLLGVLDNLSTWLPVVGLGLLAAAVADVAATAAGGCSSSGLAVAGSMLLLGATLNAIRPIYLDALPESSSAAAAGAIYDQLVSFIRVALRGVGIVGLTVAVVAWFSAHRGAGRGSAQGTGQGHRRTASRHHPRGPEDRQARRDAGVSTAARSGLPSSASRRSATWRRTTRPAVRRWRSCSGRPSCCSCSPSWRPTRRTCRRTRRSRRCPSCPDACPSPRRPVRLWPTRAPRTSCRPRTTETAVTMEMTSAARMVAKKPPTSSSRSGRR